MIDQKHIPLAHQCDVSAFNHLLARHAYICITEYYILQIQIKKNLQPIEIRMVYGAFILLHYTVNYIFRYKL